MKIQLFLLALLFVSSFSATCTWTQYDEIGATAQDCTACTANGVKTATDYAGATGVAAVGIAGCSACTVAGSGTSPNKVATLTCTACSIGYFLASGTTCTACSTGCATCTSATVCTTCSVGYFLSNAACTLCDNNPSSGKCTCCSGSATSCKPCTSWSNISILSVLAILSIIALLL